MTRSSFDGHGSTVEFVGKRNQMRDILSENLCFSACLALTMRFVVIRL